MINPAGIACSMWMALNEHFGLKCCNIHCSINHIETNALYRVAFNEVDGNYHSADIEFKFRLNITIFGQSKIEDVSQFTLDIPAYARPSGQKDLLCLRHSSKAGEICRYIANKYNMRVPAPEHEFMMKHFIQYNPLSVKSETEAA